MRTSSTSDCTRLTVLIGASVLHVLAGRAIADTSAGCGAGVPSTKTHGSATWNWSTPNGATMTWERAATNLDDTVMGYTPFYTTFAKFTGLPGGGLGGYAWPTLSTVIGTGRFGSETAHNASGSSTAAGGRYAATWTVQASVDVLGNPTPGSRAIAEGYTKGDDPWYFRPYDLPSTPLFDLDIPLLLGEAHADAMGSAGWTVGFETAGGMLNLLDVSMDSGGVHLNADPRVMVRARGTLLDSPNAPGGPWMPVSMLQSTMQADWLDNGRLDTPITIALVVTGLVRPGSNMADGNAAAVHVASYARCADARVVPGPGPLALLGLGGLTVSRRRRGVTRS